MKKYDSEALFNKWISEQIRSERKRLRRTQAEIADLLGVSQGTYSKIERAILVPTVYHIKVLLDLRFRLDIYE